MFNYIRVPLFPFEDYGNNRWLVFVIRWFTSMISITMCEDFIFPFPPLSSANYSFLCSTNVWPPFLPFHWACSKNFLNKLITYLHFNHRCIPKVRKKMGIKSLVITWFDHRFWNRKFWLVQWIQILRMFAKNYPFSDELQRHTNNTESQHI